MASLGDENRYLKAIAAIVGTANPQTWVSVADVSAHVAEGGDRDERTRRALQALSEDDIVGLSADGTQVSITPWGLLMLG